MQGDLIAGLTVGLTVIPQSLAYAKIAELPPQVRSFLYSDLANSGPASSRVRVEGKLMSRNENVL